MTNTGLCPQCGSANAYRDSHCSSCKAALPWAEALQEVRSEAQDRLELQIKEVMRGASCLLWHSEVKARGDDFDWATEIVNPEAAAEFLPVAIPPGDNYSGGFYWAKLEEERERIDALAISALRTGQTHYQQEYRIRLISGERRWLCETVQIKARPSKQWLLTGVCIDISDRKQIEAQLQTFTHKLEQSNQDLEQFAYVASHDLQEPLRHIASYAQLLTRKYQGKLDAEADQYIGYLVDGVTRMQQLIRDLLAYSRVNAQVESRHQVSCQEVLDLALCNLQMAIEESGATITYDDLPSVQGDKTQLLQLFQNLIANAIKFRGSQPPHIEITVRRPAQDTLAPPAATLAGTLPTTLPEKSSGTELGRAWRFAIKDNGIGVEPQFAERIFMVFQRLHTRRAYPGTGIGLAICKKVVERHGGRMWLESTPGLGSTFYFTLPVCS